VRKQWSLAQIIDGCARHGIVGISPWRDQVAAMGLKPAASSIREKGLTVTGLCRGGFFTAKDWRDDNRRAIEEAHELAAQCLVLVVGCFLDAIPAIIIVGTILQPLAQSVNMHPIHFAIIGIVALAFGLVTPPYGLCLMISCAVAKVPLKFALKDTLIMLVPMLLMLAAIIIWPEIPLILPRLVAPELLK